MINDLQRLGKETPQLPLSRVRFCARSIEKGAAKNDTLNELWEKRIRHQDPEVIHKRVTSRGVMYFGLLQAHAASPSSSIQSESHRGNRSAEDKGLRDIGEAILDKDAPTFEGIKETTIWRSKLSMWFMDSFFEDMIVVYTNKYFNYVWGSDNWTTRCQMTMISDFPPLEIEFSEWVKDVDRKGGRMPSYEVLEKQEAILKALTYVYPAAYVKQMLQEKKSASSRLLSVTAKKDCLRRELDIDETHCDMREVVIIRARFLELKSSWQSKFKDTKALRLAKMNNKSMDKNFKNASELKPRNYYVPNAMEEDEAAALANDDAAAEVVALSFGSCNNVVGSLAVTAVALEVTTDAGKLVDTNAPIDLRTYKIKLTFLNFRGALEAQTGFMERKQRIDAIVGKCVAENDGMRHCVILIVSNY
ncbi:hypothetical protein MKX03_028302 [Papaver bracteatum]|nr:hypothetical protein MKX03_028302 [Papaver bracteatum]